MIIRIVDRVLSDARWHPVLDVIVTALIERRSGRHAVDPTDITRLAGSAWLADGTGHRANTLEILKGASKLAARGGVSDAIALIVDDRAPVYGSVSGMTLAIHPLGAIAVIAQPFHLIVENELADGSFVLWMARALGRDAVRQAYEDGALSFRHAGGKGHLAVAARALSFGVWPRNARPIMSLQLRAGALLDSDARFPGDQPNQKIIDDLGGLVAFVHCLRARSIENYIPETFFRSRLAGSVPSVVMDTYWRQAPLIRDHFPLKRGFLSAERPPRTMSRDEFVGDMSRPQEERDHNLQISDDDWADVARGFGSGLSDVFIESAYRCEPSKPSILSAEAKKELNSFLSVLIRHL